MGEDLAIPEERDGETISFTLDGTELEGREGDTVASALHANDVRILYRSVRYHRPRGYFCGVGKCANCLMRVDGEPNVRVCTEELEEGAEVESQKGWPSARRDLLGLVDRIFPSGFDYHERFIRPKLLVPLYNAVIRRLAGFGDPPDRRDRSSREGLPTRSLSPDLLVAGAGPAGLAAAAAAAREGLRVVVAEERPRVGGTLQLHDDPLPGKSEWSGSTGPDVASDLVEELEGRDVTRVLRDAPVLGIYPPGGAGTERPSARDDEAGEPLAVVRGPDALWELSPERLVLAPGTYEAPLRIPKNDLPGVMGARAARLLLDRGVRPGRRAVVAGAGPDARRVAADLQAAGVDVAALVGAQAPDGADVPPRPDAEVAAARGRTALSGVTIEGPDGEETLDCDALVAAGRRFPRPELLQQARVPLTRADEAGGLYPDVNAVGRAGDGGVWVAGEAGHPMEPHTALVSGRAAGLDAARSVGGGGSRLRDSIDRLRDQLRDRLSGRHGWSP